MAHPEGRWAALGPASAYARVRSAIRPRARTVFPPSLVGSAIAVAFSSSMEGLLYAAMLGGADLVGST